MTSSLSTRLGTSVVLAAIVAGALTGCGSGPRDTTCGEVRSSSTAERVALLQDLYDDEGSSDGLTDEQQQVLDDFAGAGAEEQEAAAAGLVALCEPEDDDVILQDADGIAD